MKKISRPRQAKTVNPEPIAIPPLISMLARAVASDYTEIRPEFTQAWADVARLVRDYTQEPATHPANIRDINETRYDVVRAMFMARVDESRRSDNPCDRALADAVDVLEQAGRDYLTYVEVAFTDPAFYTGLALGLYLLSSPAPVLSGGVR